MTQLDFEKARKNIESIVEMNKVGELATRFNGNVALTLESMARDEQNGWPVIEYKFISKPEHLNPFDNLHGGIISGVLDSAMGYSSSAFTEAAVNTISLNISFLRRAVGNKYRVRVELRHIGRRIVNATAALFDAEGGELCADGEGIFMVVGEKIW